MNEFKKYLLTVHTNWCGEDATYGVITDNEDDPDLMESAQILAYDNFESFDGSSAILEELFPEVEDNEYSEDQYEEAVSVECEYYGWSLIEFEGDEEEWSWYDLVFNNNPEDESNELIFEDSKDESENTLS